MIGVFIFLGAMLLLIIIYLWCIMPGKIDNNTREKIKPFTERYIAHRGLFDMKLSIPENSIPAFQRAVKHGYGIELDVRLTKDDVLVVFHDDTLLRMCGAAKKVEHLTYEELSEYTLLGTDCHIPKFSEVLKVVQKDTPLIIEIKAEKDSKRTAPYLDRELQKFDGTYCIESFHPMEIRWYKLNRPDVVRGILTSKYMRKITHIDPMMFNVCSRPQFIAYNYKMAHGAKFTFMRALYSFYNAAWTIKNQKTIEKIEDVVQIFIFDSFIPEEREQTERK